jgi:ATP phosphoribosyltransferase regulatory subunit
VGLDDPQADAEVVALAVSAMDELGLPGLRISLGQVQYARGLLAECGLAPADEARVLEAAIRKDGTMMSGILSEAGVSATLIDGMMAVVELAGGVEVLENARRLAPVDECRRAVDNLEAILDLLRTYGIDPEKIHVDLGELAAFRYHTGLVFTGYTSGTGKAVLSGGRYDNLVEQFGKPDQSTGFAVDVLEVADIVAPASGPEPVIDYLVVNRSDDKEKGLCFSVELRERGRNALCLIRGLDDGELASYADAHGIRDVLVLSEDGDLLLLDRGTGTLGKCDKKDL